MTTRTYVPSKKKKKNSFSFGDLVCFSFFCSISLFVFVQFRFSFFVIRAEADYQVLNVKILYLHSSRCRISSSEYNCHFIFRFSTFGLRPSITFWMSKCYTEIGTDAEYQVLNVKKLIWHSRRARIYQVSNVFIVSKWLPSYLMKSFSALKTNTCEVLKSNRPCHRPGALIHVDIQGVRPEAAPYKIDMRVFTKPINRKYY